MPASTAARATVCTTLLLSVPPCSGCGCAMMAVARASPGGRSMASSRGPTGPAIKRTSVWAFTSAPHIGRRQQPLDHHAIAQMRLHDLVDIVLVHIGVPDRLR